MRYVDLLILVIDDSPGDYRLVSEYLQESFHNPTIFHAETLQKGIQILKVQKVDVILLDLTLPDASGIETFSTINAEAPEVPVIILTGVGDTALALQSLQIGAQDYIIKDDCSPGVLSKSIQYSIERFKIKTRLKHSEEQYKYLFHSNPLPMYAYSSATSEFLMVNQAAIRHYGYSEEEFLNMTFTDLTPSTYLLKPGANKSSSDSLDHAYDLDLQHVKKNGEIIDVEIKSHTIIAEGQKACLAVIHDVTERNNAKKLMRESEAMFRTISENFPNGSVAILDQNLTISYLAGKEFHIPGKDSSYFEDTLYTSHFPSPVREKVHEKLMEVFNGKNIVFDATYYNLSYIISAVPLYENEGEINRILIASQNITAQKKIEAEKEMLIEKLMHTNGDLQQFSYITSHNLRAPLSNLLGLIKLLDYSSIADENNQMLLKNFESCTLQLNDTVNDLIDILIIKNNVNTPKEKIDIRKTFEKVVQSVQTVIQQKKVSITADFNHAFEIVFNRAYLESILLNLVTNAVKYSSPDRPPEVKILTEKMDGGIKLYFSDNGLGIDLKRNKDRIFGLYQRFHDNADSKGLGLYMVNSQIRVMGGGIDVESEVNKGTTFIITFKN